MLTAALQDQFSYHSHFTDGETEAYVQSHTASNAKQTRFPGTSPWPWSPYFYHIRLICNDIKSMVAEALFPGGVKSGTVFPSLREPKPGPGQPLGSCCRNLGGESHIITPVGRAENAESQALFWRRKWQPTPVFLPGESQGQGRLVGCPLWGHTESDTTEVTQQQQQALFWSFRFSRSKELGMCISEAPPGKLTCSSREPRLQGSI